MVTIAHSGISLCLIVTVAESNHSSRKSVRAGTSWPEVPGVSVRQGRYRSQQAPVLGRAGWTQATALRNQLKTSRTIKRTKDRCPNGHFSK